MRFPESTGNAAEAGHSGIQEEPGRRPSEHADGYLRLQRTRSFPRDRLHQRRTGTAAEPAETEIFTRIAQLIDRRIHANYRLYPGNYIACDELEGNNRYADKYTAADKERFETYLQQKLALIQLPDKDEAFLRNRILTMYANPVINHRKATEE